MKKNNQLDLLENANNLNIREEIDKYIIYWRWFIVGIIISFLSAYLYLKYTPVQYSASAYIMIKDNLKSGISDELKVISDLGIVGNSSTNNPENEIFIIKSRKIVGKMVDSLELNIRYLSDWGLKYTESYGNNPIHINFLNKDDLYHSIDTAFVVDILNRNEVSLRSIEGDLLDKVQFNEVINSQELGQFKIENNQLNETVKGETLVVIQPRNYVISSYSSKIEITALNEFSSILHLQVKDYNRLKAEHILDEVIEQYNLDAVIDKNIVSQKTKSFVENRLKAVGLELSLIQDNLKNYKTENSISGYGPEAQIVLESNSEYQAKVNKLKTQLSIIKWAQEEISSQLYNNEVLPANLGFTDQTIAKAISEFNQLVLEKNKLQRFAGPQNPNFLALNTQIKVLKEKLQASLNNCSKSIQIQISEIGIEAKKVKSKVDKIPFLERGMIDIERQKIIYSDLYTYLLKKKEEVAISLAITVPNAKIIDVAYSSDIPVSPQKHIIYLIALLAAIFVPFLLIYIKLLLDNKLHNRKDIEANLDIPYLGDIPISISSNGIIVNREARSSTAEAFRLLRTNLSFMLPKSKSEQKGKTIFITSTISGEGKSFVSINLAATIALTNKKVLVLGLDLRAPKITDYLNISDKKGVTNFILDDDLQIDELKFNSPLVKNVDFISSGLVPPNPSELLLNKRLNNLLEIVKNDYDFIIVETAPISLVTDTLLVADSADMFLYVTRANYLDKRMLIVPKTLYKEKKLPNMAIVLNGTDTRGGYGYGY